MASAVGSDRETAIATSPAAGLERPLDRRPAVCGAVPFSFLMEQRFIVTMHVHRFLQIPVVILTAVLCMIADWSGERRPDIGGQLATI